MGRNIIQQNVNMQTHREHFSEERKQTILTMPVSE